ncbi:MAG: AhpC/TSA family protein [Bacteroidales bacterium]|nr:AhpC/TSA family protein [Candidatus Cryptobacteroides equifaecalis]
MRNTTLIIAASTILAASVSCSAGAGKCVINGSCEGAAEDAVVYMYDSHGREVLDSAAVVDGKFKFTEARSEDQTCMVVLDRSRMVVLVPDAAKIDVVLGEENKVSGSPLTDKLNEYNDTGMAKYQEGGMESYVEYCREVFEDNKDNIIGYQAFTDVMYELDLEEFDELYAEAGEKVKSDERIAALRETKLAESKTKVGTRMIDFKGVTPEGKEVALSDFVGKSKLVLVDFWASWCGPCMRSMPAMKSLYEKYHKKGLEIVGVAVWDGDNSRSRVRIEEKGMTWPQIFVGDDKTPTDIYGIAGIPHVILFDAEGFILTRGIPDEEELEEMIGERL